MPAVVLCLLVAAPAPFPKVERRGDLERLQGEWEHGALYYSHDGQWHKNTTLPPRSILIQGNDVIYPDNSRETFSLRGRTSPRGIDLSSDDTARPALGVYSIEGDTLTLVVACRGDQRPTSFDSGYYKVVYRRKR
jgi:uncharacterized protein (TIGR03067 family)